MKKAVLTILILVVALAIINLIPGLNKGLGNFVYKIFSPIERLFSNVGNNIIGFFQILTSISNLNKENLALREKNTILESELVQLKETQRENDVLKQALNITKSEHLTLDTATIVGKDIQGLQDWILIDKGSKHGIRENMTVISPEKALVGRISEVANGFSKVLLINSKESIISALIENSRIEGLVKKDEKGGIFMDFIPKTETLTTSKRIITSGTDNLYVKGILIGEIEAIDPSDNQIFQKITITPAVDFSKLEQVIIIK